MEVIGDIAAATPPPLPAAAVATAAAAAAVGVASTSASPLTRNNTISEHVEAAESAPTVIGAAAAAAAIGATAAAAEASTGGGGPLPSSSAAGGATGDIELTFSTRGPEAYKLKGTFLGFLRGPLVLQDGPRDVVLAMYNTEQNASCLIQAVMLSISVLCNDEDASNELREVLGDHDAAFCRWGDMEMIC